MTFWLTTKTSFKLDPRTADFIGFGELSDVSVSVCVPCGVGVVVARESFPRL